MTAAVTRQANGLDAADRAAAQARPRIARRGTEGQPIRIFALLTDAYGVHGGIAAYNRELLEALATDSRIGEITALPRRILAELEPVPAKVQFDEAAAHGKLAYARRLLASQPSVRAADVIYCAHINLAPVAALLGRLYRRPVVMAVHGIEAWQPTGRRLTDRLVGRIDAIFAVSEYSRARFLEWAPVPQDRVTILANSIRLERFGPAPRPRYLEKRLGIEGKRTLLTFGRLVSHERAKGFDEVLDVLPSLLRQVPDLVYIIAGDGDYRSALEAKAQALGISDHVVFAGFVDETEKADLYRCADVYVMPSRGEGFGIVLLEAMACGVPAIASTADGSREALRNGQLGTVVDPSSPDALRAAILGALARPRIVPDGLEYFAYERFAERCRQLFLGVAAGRHHAPGLEEARAPCT
jgi:glycosyltransferase involved in cell wall biosynthesis